jgi:hypothetical protein
MASPATRCSWSVSDHQADKRHRDPPPHAVAYRDGAVIDCRPPGSSPEINELEIYAALVVFGPATVNRISGSSNEGAVTVPEKATAQQRESTMKSINDAIGPRELDLDEVDAVSGGASALVRALIAAYDVIHSMERTQAEPEPPAPYVPMKL